MESMLRSLPYVSTGLSYLWGGEASWGPPVFFAIETINSCNFRCVYCPQSNQEVHFVNGRGIMPLDVFKQIVTNLRSSFHVRAVALQRDGEPLLNKRIDEYVSHLTGLGIAASFSSNCSLLDEDRVGRLLDAGLRQIKTDFCADAELYERLRARGDWQQTMNGIRTLLDAAQRRGSPLRLNITDLAARGLPNEGVEEALTRTRALFAAWSKRVTVIPVRLHNALNEAITQIGPPQPTEASHYCLCHQPWVSMTIDYDGRVVACGRDLRGEYVLGNLLEQTAGAVWNGEPMRRLRRALATRHPEEIVVCSACDVPRNGSYSGRSRVDKFASFFFSRFFDA